MENGEKEKRSASSRKVARKSKAEAAWQSQQEMFFHF
jgi:hypothetical protein